MKREDGLDLALTYKGQLRLKGHFKTTHMISLMNSSIAQSLCKRANAPYVENVIKADSIVGYACMHRWVKW